MDQSRFSASNLNKSGKKSPSKTPTKRIVAVAPEDNWNLVGNPSIYLDTLPQPYRFIKLNFQQSI